MKFDEDPHAQIRRVSPRIIPPLAMIQYMIPNPTVPSQSHMPTAQLNLGHFSFDPKKLSGAIVHGNDRG